MDFLVDILEDINSSDFIDNLSINLEILYLEGQQSLSSLNFRKRRSSDNEKETSVDEKEGEWIFSRKKIDEVPRLSEEEWIFSQNSIGKSSGSSGGEVRTKRQAEDPSEDVEVPVSTFRDL